MRKGDENIGKLIVFAITIIVAVGVLGVLSYFFTKNKKLEAYNAVLANINTKGTELKDLKICNNSTGYIKYDAVTRVYALICSDVNKDILYNISSLNKVYPCPSSLSGENVLCYKFK